MDFKLKYLISADGKQAKSELAGVEKQIDRLSQRGRSGMADVFGGNVATQAFSKLTGMATDAGTAIFDFSSRMEQSKIAFTTLMGNSAAATKHLEDLKKISMSTPLEFGSLAKMSQRLQGAGIESAKVVDLIKDIGNTAAATGDLTVERMEGIGVAISQVFSKGKVSAEEMEQLAERGIPAWRILSQSLGKTVGETRKLAEEGKITSDVFLRSFEQFTRMNFGDAMEKQASTFSGAMGKITNIATITASEAFKPIFERISRFSDDIAKSLSNQQADAKRTGISFGFAIGEAMGLGMADGFRSSQWWENAMDSFGIVGPAMAARFAEEMGKGFANAYKNGRTGGSFAPASQGWVFDPVTMTMQPASAAPQGSSPPAPLTLGPAMGAKKGGSIADNRTDKQVYQDFVAELKKLGVVITSGYRTFAQQKSLYERLPKGQAARPGTSDHEFWRAIDLPANVSQDILELAARRAGVTLDKRNEHQGTGWHNHQGFQKGRRIGGGESELIEAQKQREAQFEAEWQHIQELEAAFRSAAEDMIQAESDAADARLDIRRAEADLALEIIADQVNRGILTEREGVQRVARLKVDMLKEEMQELERQEPTVENLHKIEKLRLAIAKQEAENARLEFEYQKAITEEINKQLGLLQKKNQRPGMAPRQPNDGTEFSRGMIGGIDAATGQIRTMDDVMRSLGQTAGDVFMQMGQGLGAMLESWVLLGDQADISMKKMVASVLAGVAAKAATLSIFHLAMGIAALTPWGAIAYGNPAFHFKAAAIWGGVAAGAALGGRAMAGDSFQSGGSGSAGSSSNYSSGNRTIAPDAISRVSENAFASGNGPWQAISKVAEELSQFRKQFRAASPGDVLVAGARQQRGFIGKQVVEDIKTNAGTGAMILRSAGVS